MANWMFDRNGNPTLIHDSECFRSRNGAVIAWIDDDNVYYLRGEHAGWFEDGILYDNHNKALGFLSNATGSLPSSPGLSGTPGMPGFHGTPGVPGFSGVPGKPGRGGSWSSNSLAAYFTR
ncbi:TPA: collagen-like triple helix repeat-containing protein [Serratia fonticola]